MAKGKRMALDDYLNLHYPVTLYPEAEGGYTVEIRDLPYCISQGETLEEAMEMIEDARRLWIESVYERGGDIPLPSSEETYSGKILLRMPRSLHQRLAEGAEREGVSLNQYVVSLLSEAHALRNVQAELRSLQTTLAETARQLAVQLEARRHQEAEHA